MNSKIFHGLVLGLIAEIIDKASVSCGERSSSQRFGSSHNIIRGFINQLTAGAGSFSAAEVGRVQLVKLTER
ncbi:hypothetical protein ACVWXL_009140 [Bradyrhizobium sp. GM22.5]